MSQPNYSARRSGLAAMLASALGIVVAPIITSAYAMTSEGADLTPAWEPALGTMLGPLLTFASPEVVYATYGKAYLLVFLGFLFGLAGLYRWRLDLAGKLERWGFRLSFVGLALNLLGNITDYWVGEDTLVEEVGFVVGTALGLLALLVGALLLGIGLLRAGAAPRPGAWLLVLALPGIALLNASGFGNLPSGPVLWFCLAWLALGHYLWSSQESSARETAPAGS